MTSGPKDGYRQIQEPVGSSITHPELILPFINFLITTREDIAVTSLTTVTYIESLGLLEPVTFSHLGD